eukprot:gene32504-5343_t
MPNGKGGGQPGKMNRAQRRQATAAALQKAAKAQESSSDTLDTLGDIVGDLHQNPLSLLAAFDAFVYLYRSLTLICGTGYLVRDLHHNPLSLLAAYNDFVNAFGDKEDSSFTTSDLDGVPLADMHSALQALDKPAVVESSFPLPADAAEPPPRAVLSVVVDINGAGSRAGELRQNLP